MSGSAVFYFGAILGIAGLALTARPTRRLRVSTRSRGLAVAFTGFALAGMALLLPVSESRTSQIKTRLDEFAPVWQFREVHTIEVAASPTRVFDAIRQVRADEIAFFRTLTWIRRGGRQLPPSILNAPQDKSLIELATSTGFIRLAEDVPRELVIGTVVVAPPDARGTLTPEVFQKPLRPGFAVATMNFLVTADGPERSLVTTETRVFANSGPARRRFAAYWRVIYPGSALIRRMWLRAIQRRATVPG
jgi:hypothetical protein